MFESFALRLGLDEFYFDNYAKDGNSILRPIHYPPITSEPANAIVLLLMVISI
jgi:isopenicillin N synthase-like dioxygenase